MQSVQRSTPVAIWLVVSQLGALLSLLLWFGMASLSLLAFDSGFSIPALLFVAAIWVYPLVPLALVILAWRAWRSGENRIAAVLSALPLLPLVMFAFLALAS